MKKIVNRALILFLLSFSAFAQDEKFEKGAQEFGVSNIGIGYSSAYGFTAGANVRYQYYVLNRFSAGGNAFYNHFGDDEWFGAGPVASFIFFRGGDWFGRLDQIVTFAKFNGFTEDMATTFGTSVVSINYSPPFSNYFIGGGYATSYALSAGEVVRPNTIQLNLGFFF